MDQFSFSICLDILGQMIAFGFLAFAVVGMSLDKLLKKLNIPEIARCSVVALVALTIFVPIVWYMIYSPFSGVKVGADHIELQYICPRFSENISYRELSSISVDSQVQPTKMASFSTSALVVHTKDRRSLRSFDTRDQAGPTPAAQAEIAINRAREKAIR
ncbi:MAG: hypothetical protein K2X93_09035 [Candidatus Obscuribacterales bacterium]|nr:hypothetical protein [Candidatus Obscuribacterales bacterium]